MQLLHPHEKAAVSTPQKKIARPEKRKPIRATIGVALDDAFCFYYQDNLDRLRASGAELVFFSPLPVDSPLLMPCILGEDIPNSTFRHLESSPFTREVKSAVDAGMPVYGECGGLMYLTREIAAEKTYGHVVFCRP